MCTVAKGKEAVLEVRRKIKAQIKALEVGYSEQGARDLIEQFQSLSQ